MADAFAGGIPSIPFDGPRRRSARDLWGDVKAGLDFFAHNLPPAHDVLVRLNPYPRPWRHVFVDGHEGARLAAWYGPGREGAPAVVMVPGTFQTKDDTPRKRRALDLWRRLGAHVLILDMRGFGGSHAHEGSGGYLEARDVLAAADALCVQSGAERAFVWGESLGGATSLLAGTLPGVESRVRAVVAWSAFSDLLDASRVSSIHDKRGRSVVGGAYRVLMRMRTGNEVEDFEAYLRRCAASLGMDVEALMREASPLHQVDRLRVPATVFHAENDAIVPVEHAKLLREARAPLLDVHVLPRGAHLDFDRVAPRWYADVTARLLAA